MPDNSINPTHGQETAIFGEFERRYVGDLCSCSPCHGACPHLKAKNADGQCINSQDSTETQVLQ